MENKSLTFETKPELIKIKQISKDIVRVQIHGNTAVSVEFDNDVMLSTKGDFVVAAKGEIALISKNNPICLDSVDSNIYLNSRKSKILKDNPESKQYLEKIQEKKLELITPISLEQRIEKLEKLIKRLKCQG